MNRVVQVCLALASTALITATPTRAQDPIAVALPTAAVPTAPPSRPAIASSVPTPQLKIQPLSVTVQLTEGGTKFTGTLSGHDQWLMKTSFGETHVPLSAVAGIKFAGEGNPSTTVVLHNGDSLTGALDLNHVQIETSWGKAEINSGHISSMLFSPGLSWTTETGLSGSRWKLVAEKDNKPLARPVANAPVNTAVTNQPPVTTAAPPTASPYGYAQPLPRPIIYGR